MIFTPSARHFFYKATTLAQADKIWLLPDFLDGLGDNLDIPDPYFWEVSLFETMYCKMKTACEMIITTFNSPDILDLFEDTVMANGVILERRA